MICLSSNVSFFHGMYRNFSTEVSTSTIAIELLQEKEEEKGNQVHMHAYI
jgi:hypothetical protein